MTLPKLLAVAVVLVMSAGAAAAATVNPGRPRTTGGVALAAAVGSGGASEQPPAPPTTAPTPSTTASTPSTSARSSPTTSATAGKSGQLQVPAGLPASSLNASAPTSAPASSAPDGNVVLPVPQSSNLPSVSALKSVQAPDAIVLMSQPLNAAQTSKLHGLEGISSIEIVDTGTVEMGGSPAVTFGVDPSTFRDFTPAASASSNQLWQYMAAGSLVSSYDMATGRNLKLGTETSLASVGSTVSNVKGWMGAFASIGLPGVDMLVDSAYASDLGLTPNSGLVVSAPDLSGPALESELQSALPGSAVELLNANEIPTTVAGNTLSSATRSAIISAAMSRVGDPYVWGGAGPSDFDCSGLVQWSFRQAGILMPRVAAEQFLTGDHIPLADAQPGDLLFWTYDPSDPGYVDHTAIYLGNGMMVVAPYTGTDVQVAPVTTQDFAGAVQVVLSSGS